MVLSDKVIPDTDFTDKAVVQCFFVFCFFLSVVQCDVPVVKMLLQMMVIYK